MIQICIGDVAWRSRLDKASLNSSLFLLYPQATFTGVCEDDWLLIQRRIKGDTNFDKDWNSYKVGFGNLTTDFWLGNELLFK